MWILVLAAFVALWIFRTALALFNNYQAALKSDLPIIISPVTPLNPFWVLFRRFERFRKLEWLGRFTRYTYFGWAFDDKYAIHEELGGAFIIVTPTINEMVVADADAVNTMLANKKDFIKGGAMYDPLNVFGPNAVSANGREWQRHRKITAPAFNERVSLSVWTEASRQAEDMVASWIQKGATGTTATVHDTALLALHVLAYAGFGIQYSFFEGTHSPREGHNMSYRDALSLVLGNMILIALFSKKLLQSLWLPGKLREIGAATAEFQEYMEEMLINERRVISRGERASGNLVSNLIRASEETSEGLTDEEIYGNIFVYNLAGHESTANTIAFSIVLLAAYPKWQDWIGEEINAVMREEPGYQTAFPKLKRCLAVMLETLRLYAPTFFIPRYTPVQAPIQTLPINGTLRAVLGNTSVTINIQALHTDPKTWGSDVLLWRPDRWIVSDPLNPCLDTETFYEPPKGTFVPWSEGPRDCPGRKFAQVEFVAVMATLFSKRRVRPAARTGGDAELKEERSKLVDIVNNSSIQSVTLQMQNGGRDARLVWEEVI